MSLYRVSGWQESPYTVPPHTPGLVAWRDAHGWPGWRPPPPGATVVEPKPDGPMHARVTALVEADDVAGALRVLRRAWPGLYHYGEVERHEGGWVGMYRPAPERREEGR